MTIAHTVFVATVETFQIALLGTALGAAASLGLGLAAASNLAPAWVHRPVKAVLGIVRGVPVILLALLFVSSVGLGPFPGVLAVAVHSTGMALRGVSFGGLCRRASLSRALRFGRGRHRQG